MISIDIIKANNPDFLGNYCFFQSLVQVGSSHQVDIFCPDTKLAEIHFFVEIKDDRLVLNLVDNVDPVLVNKKITTQFKNLKVGDVISVSDIDFKIIDYKEDEVVTSRQKLNETAANLKEKNPELLKVISLLSNNP